MIIIPGDILEVKLGAAVATKQLSYNISYSDNGIITSKHGFTYNTSNIALHPISDYNITMLSFTITNLDSVAATVKIQINKAANIFNTRTIIFTVVLAPGEALQYDGDNFIVPTVISGIGGGTLSAGTATLSLGQAVFSNVNGVSFGITGQTVTASINTTAGAGINVSAGTTSNNVTNIRFQNSNGITFGINASTVTASHNGLTSQSNQVLSGSNGSFTFQTATFGNLNGLSFYTSNGSMVGSYTQSTHSHSSLIFSNSNNITFGIAGSTVTASASYTVPTVTNSSWTASAGTTSGTVGQLEFANSNGISFGLDNGTITATVKTDYQSSGNYLTTAMQSDVGSNFMGTNTAITQNGVSMTANSSGLSLNFPAFLTTAQPPGAYLTTAALSQDSSKYAGTNGAITGGSITVNTDGVSVNLPAYLTTAQPVGAYLTTAMLSNAATISNIKVSAGTLSTLRSDISFNNSNGISFGLETNGIITATVATNYQSQGAYLTTAMASNRGSDFVQATAAFAGTNASGTIASSGISVSVNAGGGVAIKGSGAQSQSTGTVEFANSNGITFGLSNNGTMTASHNGLTTAMASNRGSDFMGTNTALTANGVSMTANSSGLSLNFPAFLTTAQPVGAYLTTARASNDAIGLNTALTGNGVAWTVNSSGLSLNVPAFLTTAMQSASSSNFAGIGSAITNGTMTFGTGGLSLNLSNHLTTAMASNRGSDFMGTNTALTANGVSMTANSSGLSLNFPAFLTTAQPVGAYLTTARASNDAIGLNTALTANGVAWTVNSSGLSLNIPAFLTTAAQSDHSHGNPTLALTNLTGTTASASNGFTLSLSAAAPAAGVNIAAGTRTATTAGNLLFDNANGITFGLNAVGGSVMTASHNALTTARASNDAIGLNTAQSNVTWTVNSSGLSLDARGYAGTGTSATNASVTLNSNGLAISVAAPGAAAENNWVHLLGANTAGNTTASGSTIGWSGQGVTLSGTNGSQVVISAPGTSSLSGTGRVSISVNASTISIGISPIVLQDWHNFGVIQTMNQITNLTATGITQRPIFFPMHIDGNLTWNRGMFELSKVTNSQNNQFTFQFGLYSFANSTSINLIASLQNVYDHSSGSSASITGIRRFAFDGIQAAGSTITEGHYVGMMMFSAGAGGTSGANLSLRGGVTANPPLGLVGSGTNNLTTATSALSGIHLKQFLGRYSTTSASPPAAVALAAVQGWTSMAIPYVYLQST
jgi:hypothetical protein